MANMRGLQLLLRCRAGSMQIDVLVCSLPLFTDLAAILSARSASEEAHPQEATAEEAAAKAAAAKAAAAATKTAAQQAAAGPALATAAATAVCRPPAGHLPTQRRREFLLKLRAAVHHAAAGREALPRPLHLRVSGPTLYVHQRMLGICY